MDGENMKGCLEINLHTSGKSAAPNLLSSPGFWKSGRCVTGVYPLSCHGSLQECKKPYFPHPTFATRAVGALDFSGTSGTPGIGPRTRQAAVLDRQQAFESSLSSSIGEFSHPGRSGGKKGRAQEVLRRETYIVTLWQR